MGWVKGSLIAVGALSATVALAAVAHDAGAKGQADRPQRDGRVIVTPRIEIFPGDRARIGVSLRDLDATTAKEHKLASAEGALVDQVEAGSAAERAGIKPGDVIVSFDGERVRSVRQLQRLVAETPPDRAVKISLARGGSKVEATVTPTTGASGTSLPPANEFQLNELQRNLDRLRDLPRSYEFYGRWNDLAPGMRDRLFELPVPPGRLPFNQLRGDTGRLGVTVQALTPQLAEYFGAKEGVLVAGVSDGSPAARAGVKAGDVVTSVNGKAVKDPASLASAVREQADGAELSIAIVRDRKAQTIKVKLASAARTRPI